jgi:hypothetical protein
MSLKSNSNYREGKSYKLDIDLGNGATLKDKTVVVKQKGNKKMLLAFDDKEQWFTNEQISTKKSDKKVSKEVFEDVRLDFKNATPDEIKNTADFYKEPKVVETKKVEKVQVPSVVVNKKPVQKVMSFSEVQKIEDQLDDMNEKWKQVMGRNQRLIKTGLIAKGWEEVRHMKPYELRKFVISKVPDKDVY